VVKEAAFGDAGGGANVIDRAAGIAFAADDIAGRVEQLGAGFGGRVGSDRLHTNRLV
jgi:hypothetical protein